MRLKCIFPGIFLGIGLFSCHGKPALGPERFAGLYVNFLLLQETHRADTALVRAQFNRYLADQGVRPEDYNAGFAYYRQDGTRWLGIQEKVVSGLQEIKKEKEEKIKAESANKGKVEDEKALLRNPAKPGFGGQGGKPR
jgi:hypothetical protein